MKAIPHIVIAIFFMIVGFMSTIVYMNPLCENIVPLFNRAIWKEMKMVVAESILQWGIFHLLFCSAIMT
jgi:hypothetical protein